MKQSQIFRVAPMVRVTPFEKHYFQVLCSPTSFSVGIFRDFACTIFDFLFKACSINRHNQTKVNTLS